MSGGHLTVVTDGAGVSLAAPSVLVGSLTVEGLSDTEVDLLEAPSLELADDLSVTLPDGWSWELVDTDSGQVLRVMPLSGGGDAGGDDAGDDGGDVGGSDGSEDDSSVEPASESGDSGGGASGLKDGAGECGCGVVSGATGLAGLVAVLIAVVRRRR